MLEKAFTGNCMIRDGFVKPEQYAEYMREYADSLLTQTRPSEHKRRKVLAEGENDDMDHHTDTIAVDVDDTQPMSTVIAGELDVPLIDSKTRTD